MLQLGCETERLPPHQPPQADQGARRLEPRRRKLSGHGGERWAGTMKKPRGVGGKGDERRWQEKDGSICWVSSPIYPPPANGSPTGATLCDRTVRKPYLDTDKGV
jgi:hypothetical protein